MIELEKTYLAKYLPRGWEKSPSREICDTYYPKSERHPVLRLRRIGNSKFELTRKTPTDKNDSSKQLEETVNLSPKEYEVISKLPGKVSDKRRYYFKDGKNTAEITVFRGKLKGLVLIDFEFPSVSLMEKFVMPDYCLAEVTDEEFLAGGMIAGKSYRDFAKILGRYKYKKLFIK